MRRRFKFIREPDLIRLSSRIDPYETRVANWIRPWEENEDIDAGLLMVPFSKGAISGDNGSSGGPTAIRSVLPMFNTYSSDYDVDISDLSVRDVGNVRLHVTDISQCFANMTEAVVEFYSSSPSSRLIVIGGDHSISRPLIEGYAAVHAGKRIGVIQLDAHHDVRHLEEGPNSGNSFRAIIEGPAGVRGTNLVQIGISGFMGAKFYRDWCAAHGVTVITALELRRRGPIEVVQQALEIAGKGTDIIYVSFDVDMVASSYAPGTGGASPQGVDIWDVVEAMYMLGQVDKVTMMDFVCLDPLRDVRDSTAKVGALAILNFLAGVKRSRMAAGPP